jgi:hypothetical protein
MNKHIELVKKWLADPASVTQQELKANRNAAAAAYVDASSSDATAYADTDAAHAVSVATAGYAVSADYANAVAANYAAAAAARKWTKRYEEVLALCNGI